MALTANPLDSLMSDLRTISNESKRKFPPLREASEAAQSKVKLLSSKSNQNIDARQALYDESARILEPFIMGCEFKQNQKVVQISLNAIQRMITHQAVSPPAACKIVDCLWTLMENNLEEVKVLQIATLLLSTNNIVYGPVLARTIVLCFRLYHTDNAMVTSIASATIRQLVSNVFERVELEDAAEDSLSSRSVTPELSSINSNTQRVPDPIDYEELKSFISGNLASLASAHRMQYAPKSLRPHAADAFLLLRDLILILNEEPSLWLVGLIDIRYTLGLELLEIAFVSFSNVLSRHAEFRFLIKERVCYMILKMFSPDITSKTKNEYYQGQFGATSTQASSSSTLNPQSVDDEFTNVIKDIKLSIENNQPIGENSMRILRILSMLIQKFYIELITEGYIFTGIFTKLLENDSNLKQVSGSLKMARLSSADTGTAGTTISTVSTSEIPVVTTMISKLFENSYLLKRVHLRRVVEDLCKLNTSPYVISKLLDLGLVNLQRVGCIWDPLTEHFLVISKNQNSEVRDWGACALTHLIKQACNNYQQENQKDEIRKHKVPTSLAIESQENTATALESQQPDKSEADDDDANHKDWQTNQCKLLRPLQRLSQIPHPDIRQKQLDVVLQVIQNATGDSNLDGWPQIIDIVGTVEEWQTDNLIRIAFQCLQGIVSDYMSIIDSECVILIIAAIVKFASQIQDLNVSLTAIGLLWNVADYLHQNKEKIEQATLQFNNEKYAPNLVFIYELVRQRNLSNYESIWMALFTKLVDICADIRPAIRKSACQTLFATITTHGDMLDLATWEMIVWEILFPVLEQVRTKSAMALETRSTQPGSSSQSAYSESIGGDDDSLNSGCESMVLHHTRNTAQKQWSETQVLTLTGVTKVFTLKREKLHKISSFPKAWTVLLDFLRTAALSRVFEVSIAALKCFQDLLSIENQPRASWKSSSSSHRTTIPTSPTDKHGGRAQKLDVNLWLSIWVMPIINLLPLCDESMSSELREDYARCCFEALLQFSNYNHHQQPIGTGNGEQHQQATNADNDAEIVNKLAVDCLINRFMEVIIKYSHDERLAGKCPLPRHRISEIIFVLRALTTILRSLKKVSSALIGAHVWDQVLSLYPHLIDFATRNSTAEQIKRDSLQEVLLEYGSLLKPPSPIPTDDEEDEQVLKQNDSAGCCQQVQINNNNSATDQLSELIAKTIVDESIESAKLDAIEGAASAATIDIITTNTNSTSDGMTDI